MLIQSARQQSDEKTVKLIIQDSIQQISQSAKIAAATSGATAGTGALTWLEWIPSDIGKLATLIGLTLSIVLIYTHIKKYKREEEKHKLEMAILKREAGL